MAQTEVYYHPLLPIEHPARLEDDVCGDFVKAISEKKVLATYNDNEDHAVSMFNLTDEFIICKNSYDNHKEYKIEWEQQKPEVGHFITFRQVTNRSEENIEMFDVLRI